MEEGSGKRNGEWDFASRLSAIDHGTELGPKICGAELGAMVCGVEVSATSVPCLTGGWDLNSLAHGTVSHGADHQGPNFIRSPGV
jgi:hypothetical protein